MPEPKNEIPITMQNECMYAMNYFDGPVSINKTMAIDHLEDAMIRTMSRGHFDWYHEMERCLNEIKNYPDNTNFIFKYATKNRFQH